MASLRRLSVGYYSLFHPCCTRSNSGWMEKGKRRLKLGKPRLRVIGFDRAGFHEPEIYQSYEQIQAARTPKDPEVDHLVNIGLPTLHSRQEVKSRHKQQKEVLRSIRDDPRLEKAARLRSLQIPLSSVAEDFRHSDLPREICNAAMHYGIFQDLFGHAFFYPQIALHIGFASGEDESMPVYRGNLISPADARKAPEVNFVSDDASLWTLILTNLDGHLQNPGSEYVHWFKGNIAGSDVNSGEELIDYLQPLPLRGTGFHRYVFLLFKQEGPIDYSPFKRQKPCLELQSRTFHMPSFYRSHQHVLTPAGLAFFLSEWDESVSDTFHQQLDAAEPAFEYQHRPQEHPLQRKYPAKQPFNMYLDRYRDRREMAEEMVKKRMKLISPFQPDAPRMAWPLAQVVDRDLPTWKKVEMRKEMLGHARFKLIYNPWARWGGVN